MAKVQHFGVRPADPSQLSFEARLLWVGAFVGGEWSDFSIGFPCGVLLALAGVALYARGWWRGAGDGRIHVLVMLAGVGLVLTLLVQRLFVLPGMLAPVIGVVLLARIAFGPWLYAIAITAQAFLMHSYFSVFKILWYMPPGRTAEQARLVDFVRAHVPPGEAIATDYENSSMLLATTLHPVILQPKYETLRSRERIRDVYTTMFQDTPEALKLLLSKYRCRYLLVDRMTLRFTMSYAGGIRDMPTPVDSRTAFGRFWNDDTDKVPPPAGYKLLYRSDARGLDLYRLYVLE